ncbi:LytR/AlgR family response regulator transcription factor [Arenibacter algicola]|uniref:LytR/AlgR family response regulator transcription factor n=1 Tax=Arenibacter algicola TaxID=616991 RepID=UPI0004DFB5B2|nr:LytTR family DNA-binding domain-containing protein [Arenibacter algicola]
MKLRCIIVDDSSMQRTAIARMVNNHPNLALVAEYSNAIEAKNGLKNYDIDLIFLDVEMPIINGFDLLESLDNPPQVILITGNPDYALKAFDYNVTDYLYKPISLVRFDASVKRAVAKYEQINKLDEEEEYIFVKSNLRQRKVVLSDINWVEALGDYIKLVTTEGNVVILSTMKSFEQKLPKDKFLRIHKSYIVNLEKVEKFNTKKVEVAGTSVPLSRNKKTELAEALYNV